MLFFEFSEFSFFILSLSTQTGGRLLAHGPQVQYAVDRPGQHVGSASADCIEERGYAYVYVYIYVYMYMYMSP